MSSLAHCIDISGISKIEGDKLKAAAKVYRSEGYSAKDANTGAVQDAISAINGERNDIVKQIKKQLPEHFKEPEAKPEKIEEKKAKPIPEIKEKAAVTPKPTEKPTEQLGKVWIKNIQKPIMSAREITKGKNKGKHEVVLTKGRDAEGNIKAGLKRIVAKDDIVAMPGEKPTGVEPLFQKRTTATAKGVFKAPDLQPQINEITARWKNAPGVEIIQSQAELPEGIQSYIKKDDIVDGVYYHGKVYIVADNTASIEAAAKTLLHESFGHYGLREMLGNDFGKIMQDVYISKRDEVQKIADEYGYDIKTEKGKVLSAEEWLSREAVNKPESGWVKRAMAVIRHFARRLMPSLRLSDAEIRQMLEAARSYVERGRPKVSDGIGAYFGVPGYQMAGPKAIGAPTGQLVKAQGMLAEGKDKKEVWRETGWMKGAEGKWRFEIDDSGAELKIKTSLHPPLGIDTKSDILSGILSHPELFKAYPKLRNLLTSITIGKNVTSKGKLTEGRDRSAEGLKNLEPEITVYAKDMAEAKDILLHEIQHAIQSVENFARGSSPGAFAKKILSENTENDVVRMYIDGKSYAEIKRQLRLQTFQVRDILQKYNILIRPSGGVIKIPITEYDKVVDDYLKGKRTLKAIAEDYSVHETTILKILKDSGVERRIGGKEKLITNADKIANILNDYTVEKIGSTRLARKYNVSESTIDRLLAEQGISKGKFTADDINEIKRLYIEEKLPAKYIGASFNVDLSTILRRLKKEGVEIRANGESQLVMLDSLHKWATSRKTPFQSEKNNGKWLLADSNFELARYLELEEDDNVESYKRNSFIIPYNNGKNLYYPDIIVQYKNGDKVVEEIKPKWQITYGERINDSLKKGLKLVDIANDLNINTKTAVKFKNLILKKEAAVAYLKPLGFEYRIITEKELKKAFLKEAETIEPFKDLTPDQMYQQTAGEIEARDTATRANLTPAQRGQSFNKVKGLFEQTQKIRQFDKYKTEEKTWLASDMTDADLKSRNESSAHKKLYAIENEIMDMGYNLNQKLVREALAGDKSAQDQLIQFPYESQGIPQDQWIITEGKGTSFRIEETPAFAKRKPSTVEIDTTGYLPTEVEKRMARAKGGPKVEFKEKLKERITEIRHQRQHFPDLKTIEDETLRAKVNDILRRHQEIPETAKNEAVQKIQSFTKNLSKDGYNVYRMNIILADMMRDIHNGLTYDGKLPFGFKTTEEVESAYAKFQEISRQHPEIADALKKRSDTINDIKRRLVKARLLKKEVLKDDDYFHHQVIEYWEKKYGMMTGSRDVRTHWRPWMTARKGSPLDYNTDYIEAEYTAISQQLAQLKVVETLKRIKKEADIYVSLKREAKTKNVDNLWKLLRERGEIEINDKTGKEIDPLLPWKQKIAMSNANLAQMASEGTLEYDSEWEGIVNALADSYDGWKANKDDIPDYPRPGVDDARWFHFLSYLINTKKPGANWAATVFKAIRGRDKYIEETLGNQFLTYDKLIPKGYTIWKPDPKKGWFWANVVTDKILEKMQRGEISPHDVEAKKLLAKGRDLTWIIPEGLTTTMDNFKGQIEPAWIGKIADTAMRSWKQYILLNPYSVIRYNLNNTSGDLDATLAYAPEISRKYALKAFKDLWKWHRRRKLDPAIQQEIDFAQSAGALQSGFSVQEVTDVYEVLSMDRFVKDIILDEKPNWFTKAEWYGVKPTWMKYWTFVRMMTAMRENTLRLAAYRFFMDNQDKRLYGASNPVEVDAVSDPKEKAAKLARELLGDYGNISKSGEWIRKRLCPFYSWLEINAPRYVYMMRNTKYENRDVDSIEKRAAAVTAKKLILASGKFAIRASMLMGAVTLWNLTVFPDEEEELGETGRRQMHLILGRREDGSIITLRFQGALSDALSFFALEDWPSDMKDVLQDKRTVIDKLKEAPLALLNRGVQSIRPEPKMLGEMISGKSFYPDILRPLPIRDRTEHALRTFKLDRIYREALERPGRGKTPGASRARQVAEHFVNDLKSLLVYESDPGLLAYYDTRQMVNEWLAKQGDEKRFGGRPTEKGNAFYYYKQAMKYGDLDASQRYLNKYYELGGTLKSRLQSVKYAHPMSSISGMKRIAFRQALTPAQEVTLQRALEWYNKTYK